MIHENKDALVAALNVLKAATVTLRVENQTQIAEDARATARGEVLTAADKAAMIAAQSAAEVQTAFNAAKAVFDATTPV